LTPRWRRSRKLGIENEENTAQRSPSPLRRVLEQIAAHPEGCTEAVLAAENVPADVLIELVQSGLVIARNEYRDDEEGAVEVTRVWITEAGNWYSWRGSRCEEPPSFCSIYPAASVLREPSLVASTRTWEAPVPDARGLSVRAQEPRQHGRRDSCAGITCRFHDAPLVDRQPLFL
jgi:hypothetical protein